MSRLSEELQRLGWCEETFIRYTIVKQPTKKIFIFLKTEKTDATDGKSAQLSLDYMLEKIKDI